MHQRQTATSKDLTGTSTFFALSAAAFVSGANLRLFDSLLPGVAEDFGTTPTAAAVVVTAFTLAYGLFQVVYGTIGDRLGKLRVIAAATLIAAAASLGSAFAPGLSALAWTRFAAGVGAAGIVPLALAWLGDNSSYDNRQAVLGRFVGFLLLGQVLGPAFGGFLSQLFSWREVFYGLTAVFFGVALFILAEDRRSRLSSHSPAGQAGGGNVLGGYLSLLRDPWSRIVLTAVFFEGAFIFGAFAYAGAYLKGRFNLSFAATGALLACYGTGGVIYSLLVRRLLSRMRESAFVKLAGYLLLCSFVLLPLLPAWQLAVPVLTTVGFGFYLFHNTLQTKATEMAPQARGTALAVFAFGLFTGQAGGVSISARVIGFVGYPWTFASAGVLLLILSRWFAAELDAHTAKSREEVK